MQGSESPTIWEPSSAGRHCMLRAAYTRLPAAAFCKDKPCPCLQNTANVDPESLERENDRGIEALGERVNLLRSVSLGPSAGGLLPAACDILPAELF